MEKVLIITSTAHGVSSIVVEFPSVSLAMRAVQNANAASRPGSFSIIAFLL